MKKLISVILFLCSVSTANGYADELLTQKCTFTLPEFTTFGGKSISDVKVGWESYGTLNKDKSNVILVTHFFSGTSHAAGKYRTTDSSSGYWDSIIGPEKAIDTDKFFVVSVDTLVNLHPYSPNVITTGPATINPKTGKPYGLSFPVVTIRDFVNVQKALLESLGIKKLYAVIGASMGSMQAAEWASVYPDWVPRMISVIGTTQSNAWTTAALESWAIPIRLDPNWHKGNYYGLEKQPVDGLKASLMLISMQARHPKGVIAMGDKLGYQPVEPEPLEHITQSHSIVNEFAEMAAKRATYADANHLLYLVRASQLFITGHGDSLESGLQKIQAKTLFISAQTDLLLYPALAESAHSYLRDKGHNSAYKELTGPLGHLEGVLDIQEQAAAIEAFLAD